jgi:hypothetical protein
MDNKCLLYADSVTNPVPLLQINTERTLAYFYKKGVSSAKVMSTLGKEYEPHVDTSLSPKTP